MIELYTQATSNGHKVSILLEELGLAYRVVLVDLVSNEQKQPPFVAINPNGRIPAIVDPDGPDGRPISVWESGAILVYLAEKQRSALLPSEPRRRAATFQWLMFQMAGVGPMFGQAGHFTLYSPEKVPYAIERYTKEAQRLLGVMDGELAKREYLAGDDYTIADIATFPWLGSVLRIPTLGSLQPWPNVLRWYETIGARPAVQRGLAQPPRRS